MSNFRCALSMNNRYNVESWLSIYTEKPQVVVGTSADLPLFGVVHGTPRFTIFFAESCFYLHKYHGVLPLHDEIYLVLRIMPLLFYHLVPFLSEIGCR